jgi:hypothetical protein
MTPAPSPPFPLPPKSAPSTWVRIAKALALGALLLCFLPRKASEPAQDQAPLEPKVAPRAQLVKLPPRLTMPDHSMVDVSYRGELANETLLPKPVPPMTPNRLGDTFLDRYANRDGVFVLVCSGSLEADGVKKRIEIV